MTILDLLRVAYDFKRVRRISEGIYVCFTEHLGFSAGTGNALERSDEDGAGRQRQQLSV